MKKLLLVVAALVLVFGLGACSKVDEYEIAMITDSGGIDDESFNQGTWEGIVEFAEDNDLTYKYYKPLEVSDAAYLDTIALAIEGGAKIVVTPGYLFETSIYEAQDLYPDVYFVLIDGVPHEPWDDDTAFNTADNTLPILFNEHEAGFLAGYAAVIDGYRNLGFTGGMAVPAVVKFGVGFIAGAYYAAAKLDVDIVFGDDTYHYFGDFAPSDNFKNMASSWYTTGTEIIFSAAGGAGASVMAAAADNSAMMIGVDIDQADQSDTVLTSAMKQLGNAVQQALQAYIDGDFVGGAASFKGASNDGVALPMDTSRFATFSVAQYDAIYALLVDGTVVVPADYATLVTFLDDATLDYPSQAEVEGTTE
ncbi:MAG: Membrane lipoprotein TmpC precursor [Candidatus Izimaplasma bacterium HR2]|nr:MAG: Membrane lipoprotein TmpC precursor [Candidatus Izimaplasma bacterium HR2]